MGQDGRWTSVELDREEEASHCLLLAHVCVEGDVEEACANLHKTVLHSDMFQVILVGQMWMRESSLKETGRAA